MQFYLIVTDGDDANTDSFNKVQNYFINQQFGFRSLSRRKKNLFTLLNSLR